jgi:hypothetical protein
MYPNGGSRHPFRRSFRVAPPAAPDPQPTLMTALPGEPRRPKADDQIACEPSGNDLRLKDRAPVARLVILGWGGAKRACSPGRAQTGRDLRR